VEMTRQNVTDGPREILTSRCPVCAGDGFVVSEATHALEIERRLRTIAKGSRVQAFQIALHPRVLSLIAGPGGSRLEAIESAARRRFFLTPTAENGHVHLDHFEVLAQGKLETLRPPAPVTEGASIDLKLVEVGLHDPTAGVGKIGDYQVVVAGMAKLVGKKVTALVGRALEGTAYALPADDAVVPSPITFEAEAERPTRAPGRKKVAEEPDVEASPEDETTLDVDASLEAEVDPDDAALEIPSIEPEDEQTEALEGDPPKKKRTRRGTRGGRGRKKPGAATTAAAVEESSDGDGAKPAPRIHVPPPELAVEAEPAASDAANVGLDVIDAEVIPSTDPDGQPKRKRSRRGSRGGRKRRKPSANGDQTAAATDEVDGVEIAAVDPQASAVVLAEGFTGVEPGISELDSDKSDAPEYVPMSEWIEDFDTRRP